MRIVSVDQTCIHMYMRVWHILASYLRLEVLQGKVPVHQRRQKRLDVLWACVLKVQVVRVLPRCKQSIEKEDKQSTSQSVDSAIHLDRIELPRSLVPTVHREERLSQSQNHRVFCVGRLHQVQLTVLFDQPQPSRAEECARRAHGLELFSKGLVRSERLVDHLSQLAAGGAAARGLDRLPEKVVVVDLRGTRDVRYSLFTGYSLSLSRSAR